MLAGELLNIFRTDVSDIERPFVWSDTEVYVYMLDAYRMFARLTGGIADFTSDASRSAITTGSAEVALSRSIMRIMKAFRVSDGVDIKVLNQTDIATELANSDYGTVMRNVNAPRPGSVTEMIIGRQKGIAHFTVIPREDDTIQMSIYRIPLDTVLTGESELTDVDDEHHVHFLPWMKYHAYRKQDIDTFNMDKSDKFAAEFRDYCAFVNREWERMKHKTRVVEYGGL